MRQCVWQHYNGMLGFHAQHMFECGLTCSPELQLLQRTLPVREAFQVFAKFLFCIYFSVAKNRLRKDSSSRKGEKESRVDGFCRPVDTTSIRLPSNGRDKKYGI